MMARNDVSRPPLLHPFWRGAAAYGIIVGVAMIAVWAWLIATGGYPELDTAPLTAWIHLATEIATALILIVAGFALLAHRAWARKAYLVAIGALLFAVVNAVAFYGERGDIPLVIFFVVLAILGVFFAIRAEE
ncbi:MAG TPA: hypothetical protein PKA74_06290 [Bauldia sp.]|nr:hypothetical protein [Bauldia sp.]